MGNPGDVANMSLGGSGTSTAMESAVQNAAAQGIAFVLAAGNSSSDANNFTPARTNGPNIYTVSATDINDDFAYFSNYGNPPVDYAAPGVAVESLSNEGGTVSFNGTSMAAPHVAGLLLLGSIQTDGFANGADGTPDPIAHGTGREVAQDGSDGSAIVSESPIRASFLSCAKNKLMRAEVRAPEAAHSGPVRRPRPLLREPKSLPRHAPTFTGMCVGRNL